MERTRAGPRRTGPLPASTLPHLFPSTMKHLLVTIAAGTAAYWLINSFILKDSDDDPGFIQITPGFGIDDAVAGGGTALVAMWLARLVR